MGSVRAGLCAAILLGATAAWGAESSSELLKIGGGNALTLPAQRHLVRVPLEPADEKSGRAAWLLAVQQDGVDGRGLALWRSDDEAKTFRHVADLQPAAKHRDTADLLVVGTDVASAYAFEGPKLEGSSAHDVYFRWIRYDEKTALFTPAAPVKVFDAATDEVAYSRAQLARDSKGRLWVQAFRMNADGSSTAVVAVSEDGGESFTAKPALDTVAKRGGGRLIASGERLLFVYAMHDGLVPTRFRVRTDDAPLEAWSPVKEAFSEGIYHGAALSAVDDGKGGVHLVYKSEAEEILYRHFDGKAFGESQLLEDGVDWASQPAVTRVGDTLHIFYNRAYETGVDYDWRAQTLAGGVLSEAVAIDESESFKGYPAAAAVLPELADGVPTIYGSAKDAGSSGVLKRVFFKASPKKQAAREVCTEDAQETCAAAAAASTSEESAATR